MKNLRTILMLMTFITIVYSCSSSRGSAGDGSVKRKGITTLKPTTTTPGIGIVNAAGDGLGQGINSARTNGAGSEENAASIANNAINKANAVTKVSPIIIDTLSDEDFVNKSAVGEMMEIKMSKEIQQFTNNESIKNYAALILNDHQQIQIALRKLPGVQSIQTLESRLNSALKNPKNDFEYIQQMILSNQKMIRLFTIGSRSNNEVIRNFSLKYLPLLKNHLEQAQELTKLVGSGIHN